ncbi:MAG: urease accessory protein UreD [Nitrospiraceae bacterium]
MPPIMQGRTTTACDEHETLARVGRVGELVLDYSRQGRNTVLSGFRSRSPWHLFPPISLDDTGCAYTLLLNPSGGLVGGDQLSLHAKLGPRAHVLFSTPSANRIYRSASETSTQSVDLLVGPDAIVEWLPEVTIPYAGSRFRQRIHVELEPGATLLLWDAIASGRIARGERWAFASLDNEIRITIASGQSVLERYQLQPTERGRVGLATAWDYVASLHLVNDSVNSEVWKQLEEHLATILEERPGSVLGGVSQSAVPGLAVKLVARSAPDLNAVLEGMWGAIRAQLWSLPAPALRRY